MTARRSANVVRDSGHCGVRQGTRGGDAELAADDKARKKYRVRLANGMLRDVSYLLLSPVTVVPSSFPLSQLPAPVIALVLFWLPMREAAELACVSKRFADAFRDNVAWKRRCMLLPFDVEAAFVSENESSWMAFYDRHANYRIRIVTVFTHRGGKSVSGDFVVGPFANDCGRFVEMVKNDPRNRQKHTAKQELEPHNPSLIGGRDPSERLNKPGPNCTFVTTEGSATIAQAGLCNGAVLEQQERLRCD